MNRVRKISLIVAVNLVLGLYLAFAGQAFSATPGYVEVDAERVAKHIKEADVRRMSRQARTTNGANQNQIAAQQSSSDADTVTEMPKHVPVKRHGRWLTSRSRVLNVAIPDTENRAVRLSRANTSQGTGDFIVNLPETDHLADAKVSADGSVVYPEYQQTTDVAVESFEDSARIVTVLNGPDSPAEYAYRVEVPAGGKIEKLENGGVFVLDNRGGMVGGFAPPWAIDNAGKDIPTRYEIRDNTVV